MPGDEVARKPGRDARAARRKPVSDPPGKHMAHVLMHDRPTFARHLRAAGATMPINVLEHASPGMVARARSKTIKAGVDVSFKAAVVEALPFPEAQFDVVLSTLMVHHVPRPLRRQCFREVRRVLKPQGRVLVVDFGTAQPKSGLLAHFHRHGHVDFREVSALLEEEGLRPAESGRVGISSLQFVLAVSAA